MPETGVWRVHRASEFASCHRSGCILLRKKVAAAASLFSASHLLSNHFSQLKELRTTDKKSSLLHFLVNTAERKFPQAFEFLEELTVIKKAARGMRSLYI